MEQAGCFWYAQFDRHGALTSLERTKRTYAKGSSGFLVEADTRQQAESLALEMRRSYERNRVAKRRAQYHEQGRCRCGRERDSDEFKRCRVCREKGKRDSRAHHQRQRAGALPAVRDESARVESCQARIRDRRAELTIETLLRVREAWQAAPNNGRFTDWLEAEISSAIGRRVA